MNEQNPTESAPIEGTGVPTPASPASGQPSSTGASGASASVDELVKRLDRVERLSQSVKDRAISDLHKEVEALNRRISEFSGEPPKQETPAATVPQVSPGTANGLQAVPEALQRFTETGLSVSDPDVASLIGKAHIYASREALLLEAERLITRKVLKPQVGAAAVISPPASPAPSMSVQELTQAYRKEVIANRGKGDVITALRKKYQELGVPVHDVTFS